ncbi:MAG: hypothetical protein AAFQ82_13595 [Myxococcota bacterium]
MNHSPLIPPRSYRTAIVLSAISALACGASTVTDGSSLSPEPAAEMGSDPAPSGDAPGDERPKDTAPEPEEENGPCVEVTFEAGFNGRLDGDSHQCVYSGETTTSVFASSRSGFRFESWSDGNTENPRVLNAPSENLHLEARFVTSGVTTLWIGYSFIRQHASLLDDLARNNAGFVDNTDFMTFSGGCSGAPGSIWQNTSLREEALDTISQEKPDNIVLGYFANVGSDYVDYARWVEAALLEVPRVRVYLVLPWLRAPFGAPAGGSECGVQNPGSAPWVDNQGLP